MNLADRETISLLAPKLNNYYHWITEGLARFNVSIDCQNSILKLGLFRILLSYDYFVGQNKAPGADILLPDKVDTMLTHSECDDIMRS